MGTSEKAMQPAKNGRPASSMKLGVRPATCLQPQRENRTGDANIMAPVAKPVYMATSPMYACTACCQSSVCGRVIQVANRAV